MCFADKILLNKTDLADEATLKKIEGELRKLNPTTNILRCQHCKKSRAYDFSVIGLTFMTLIFSLTPVVSLSIWLTAKVSPKELLNINAFELGRVLDFDPEFLDEDAEHEHDATVTSVSCRIKGNVNQTMLSRWIGRLIEEDGANLYRYKGILAIKGVDEKFIFQGVGMLFNGNISEQKWGVEE